MIDVQKIRNFILNLFKFNNINYEDFELIDIKDDLSESTGIRCDLFSDNNSSRLIILKEGSLSIEVIDSESDKDLVFDNYDELSSKEIENLIKEVFEKYHSFVS